MEDLVYVWPEEGVYCWKEDLEDYVERHGEDYEAFTWDEFYEEVTNDDS